jgi:hypothetical protein
MIGFLGEVSGVGCQVSEIREPQPATSSAESKTEQGITNVEGKLHYSKFLVGYSIFNLVRNKTNSILEKRCRIIRQRENP